MQRFSLGIICFFLLASVGFAQRLERMADHLVRQQLEVQGIVLPPENHPGVDTIRESAQDFQNRGDRLWEDRNRKTMLVDPVGRVVAVEVEGIGAETEWRYSYNAAGQWTDYMASGAFVDSVAVAKLVYGAEGNLTEVMIRRRRGSAWTHMVWEWQRGRLIRLTVTDAALDAPWGHQWSYAIDSARIGVTTRGLDPAGSILQQAPRQRRDIFDDQGQLVESYVYEPESQVVKVQTVRSYRDGRLWQEAVFEAGKISPRNAPGSILLSDRHTEYQYPQVNPAGYWTQCLELEKGMLTATRRRTYSPAE